MICRVPGHLTIAVPAVLGKPREETRSIHPSLVDPRFSSPQRVIATMTVDRSRNVSEEFPEVFVRERKRVPRRLAFPRFPGLLPVSVLRIHQKVSVCPTAYELGDSSRLSRNHSLSREWVTRLPSVLAHFSQ
jgi:hypothetical protein